MPADYKIRAVTIHMEKNASMREIEDTVYRAKEAIDMLTDSEGLEVWSFRIVLPSRENLAKAVETARELEDLQEREGIFVNLGLYSIEEELLDDIAQLVDSGFFLSIKSDDESWDEYREISRFIHSLSDKSPDYAVHLAFNPKASNILTAYFPLATSPGNKRLVTAALLYPNYLAQNFRSGGINQLEAAMKAAARRAIAMAEAVARETLAEVGGVDLSVSPWMEESSLALVETLAGVRMPNPGFAYGLRVLNEIISRVAGQVVSTGFNEVQLPVAEDSRLKVRVAELNTTARDLLRLSGVCLAGLDMAVIPASVDGVAGLLLDAVAYSRAKKGIVGVRVIPVEGVEPGDEVFLRRFGEVPVIPI
ncbi:MAG: DUF711 family protein [Aeropyrum sp.]|nr:DUF711 family protein [Aeropyrum sp.]